jgi:hypothetical protein
MKSFVGFRTHNLNYSLSEEMLHCLSRFCAELSLRGPVILCGVHVGARLARAVEQQTHEQHAVVCQCVTFGLPILRSDDAEHFGAPTKSTCVSFYDPMDGFPFAFDYFMQLQWRYAFDDIYCEKFEAALDSWDLNVMQAIMAKGICWR